MMVPIIYKFDIDIYSPEIAEACADDVVKSIYGARFRNLVKGYIYQMFYLTLISVDDNYL